MTKLKSARAAKAPRSTRPHRRTTVLFRSGVHEKRAREACEAAGVPLWVLMIPGLDVAGPDIKLHMQAIHKLVEAYIAEHIFAPAIASVHRELRIGAN